MNKLKLSLITLLIALVAAPSFALLRVEGYYTGYANGSGPGVGVSFPLLPFLDTTIVYSDLGENKISLGSFTYDNKTFAAPKIKVKQTVLELQVKVPLELMGVSVGGSLFMDILSAKEPVSGDSITLPGNLYLGLIGQYRHNILPLFSVITQLGYNIKVVDTEKIINDDTSGNDVDLSDIDKSGFNYRLGLSLGF